MGDAILLVVATVWLLLLGLGALIIRREFAMVNDRLASIGTAPMDGMPVGAPAPRLTGLRRDDAVLFLFGDCAPCHEIADLVRRSLQPDRYLCVVNDGTIEGSARSVLDALPHATRRVVGAEAMTGRTRYHVNSAPFGFAVVDGLIAAKGSLRGRQELDRLVVLANGHSLLPMARVPHFEHSDGHGHEHEHAT